MGQTMKGRTRSIQLNLHSGYQWAGFNMGAFYSTGSAKSVVPPLVTGAILDIHSDNASYGYTLSHLLPLRGSFSGGINRTTWNTTYMSGTFHWSH